MDSRTVEELRRDRAALDKATILKLRAERRTLHEMLTEAGIPEAGYGDGVRTCLIGRVGIALARLRAAPSTALDLDVLTRAVLLDPVRPPRAGRLVIPTEPVRGIQVRAIGSIPTVGENEVTVLLMVLTVLIFYRALGVI